LKTVLRDVVLLPGSHRVSKSRLPEPASVFSFS